MDYGMKMYITLQRVVPHTLPRVHRQSRGPFSHGMKRLSSLLSSRRGACVTSGVKPTEQRYDCIGEPPHDMRTWLRVSFIFF